jgi:hypothetical protein
LKSITNLNHQLRRATMSEKQVDAELILRLYELRRDEMLRRARRWYFTEFDPQSGADIARLLAAGHDQSAYFRMITSYWEMASSFVSNGAIDEKMFLDANGEHMSIFAKLQPYIAELRETIRRPEYLVNLEALAMKTPNATDRLEQLRGLLKRWGNAASAAS